ncbi:MAG: hypothetical protein PHO41_05740 [Eubacteriales bacterium]|nr:hypothetical protein [Eubacteriales bacterium]
MKKSIRLINGMPVEISETTPEIEAERARIEELALKEYEETGSLSSQRLQEESRQFTEKAWTELRAKKLEEKSTEE